MLSITIAGALSIWSFEEAQAAAAMLLLSYHLSLVIWERILHLIS
jgi:hypothetical protein